MMPRKTRSAIFAFFGLLILSGVASAATVLPLGMERLHGDAKFIFLGQCLNNTVEMDQQSGRVVTYTTFEVVEAYKGQPGRSLTIKQVGGDLPDRDLRTRVPGVPSFEVGKRYVVFLPPKSNLGFSSPVGLSQGKFNLTRNAQGDDMVSNGRDVGELMENMAASKMPPRMADKMRAMPDRSVPANAKARAEMHLDDLRSILRGME